MNPKVVKLFKVLYHLVVLVLIAYLYLSIKDLQIYTSNIDDLCYKMQQQIEQLEFNALRRGERIAGQE